MVSIQSELQTLNLKRMRARTGAWHHHIPLVRHQRFRVKFIDTRSQMGLFVSIRCPLPMRRAIDDGVCTQSLPKVMMPAPKTGPLMMTELELSMTSAIRSVENAFVRVPAHPSNTPVKHDPLSPNSILHANGEQTVARGF